MRSVCVSVSSNRQARERVGTRKRTAHGKRGEEGEVASDGGEDAGGVRSHGGQVPGGPPRPAGGRRYRCRGRRRGRADEGLLRRARRRRHRQPGPLRRAGILGGQPEPPRPQVLCPPRPCLRLYVLVMPSVMRKCLALVCFAPRFGDVWPLRSQRLERGGTFSGFGWNLWRSCLALVACC